VPQWEQLSLWKDESFPQDTLALHLDFHIVLRWIVTLGITEDVGELSTRKLTQLPSPHERGSQLMGVPSMLRIPLVTSARRLSSMQASYESSSKHSTEIQAETNFSQKPELK
jgi:hypothetical protein